MTAGEDYLVRISTEGAANDSAGTLFTSCARLGDLNGDGSVNAADLSVLLGGWGTSGPTDLNGDGTTNAADLSILLGAWG
ncbi:MAG: dockerin type I domain-containing protein [Phycisphaerales bacterium]